MTPTSASRLTALLTALVAALPVSAQTSGPEASDTVSALGDTDRLVWTAAALETLLERRDYPSFLLISTMGRPSALDAVELAELDHLVGSISPSAASEDDEGNAPGRAEDLVLASCRADPDVASGTLCSMERLAELAPPALADDITEEGARLVALSLPSAGRGSGSGPGVRHGLAVPAFDPLQGFGERALESVWRRAHGPVADVGRGSLLDNALKGLVGISPRASAAEVLGAAPRLRSLLASYPVVGELAPVGASADSARHAYESFSSGLAWSAAPSLGLEAPHADWATGRSFVYLAAESARLAGTGTGAADRMRALGSVAVDFRRETSSFSSALATMGRELAVATLSGNVLALASRVTSFFRGSPGALGPDAARDVHALRDGLQSMRRELRLGLDEVDRGLDDLLVSVDARFSELEGLVQSTGRDTRADLEALHADVLALGERLHRMDASIRSYVSAGFDRDHARTLVRCLEHRERYLPPWNEMTFDVFSDCLADLRARAVADARDALLVDRSTPIDDLSVITALGDQSLPSLAQRLPLLARVAAERFAYPDLGADARLANAVEWAVAAEAYVTLLHDWPGHARAVSPEDLGAMVAVGRDLQGALRAVSTDAATGETSPLLGRVVSYYRERLDELGREADSLAHRHRQLRLLRVPTETLITRMGSEDGRGVLLDVPSLIAHAVPAAARNAAVLGLDRMELIYALESQDSVTRANSRRRFLFFGRRHDRFTHTRVTIHVELRLGSVGTIARWKAAGPYWLGRTDEMKGDERSERVASSRIDVRDPFAHFLTVDWPSLAADPDAWEVEPAGSSILDELETRIDAELRRHSTVGLENLFGAVCSDEPDRFNLSRADRASALVVRSALNGLSAARTLLQAYLRLATTGSMDEEESEAEARWGLSALLDRRSLCAGIDQGESPLRMLWLEGEEERRLEELREHLPEVLPRAAPGEDTPTFVDSTLVRLDAALRVQRLRAAVATAETRRSSELH